MILSRQRRRPVALVGLAAAGLLLTGCGSSIGIHPGSAAVIGDDRVSMSTIDNTATLYCKAFVTAQQSQQQQSGPAPMGLFRSFAAAGLAKRALGEQLADEYGVEPASGYQAQVTQLQQVLASAPQDQRDAVIAVSGSDAYLQNVEVAIGQQLTGKTGQSNAEIKAALERGQVATKEWLNNHDVFLDPVFGLSVDGGKFTQQQDETSYPLSALASAGAQVNGQQGPPETYTSKLPTAQVCG
ncbi:MAG TPA: hypothetical protein VGK78_13105 [Nocardioides sp.]|uniref:hypothetical protein n=1 Tax=Nocardioides sp. TaxID=35761 RepID=UPI002F3EB69F